MSGYDKTILKEKLKALGWIEDEGYYMKPGPDLFKNTPKRYYVYDARNLEMILHAEDDEIFEYE